MQSFESQSWYRVAHLRPALSDQAEISRQVFRGTTWFVVRNPVNGRFHRLTEAAYTVVAMMDGTRPLGRIWDLACCELGDHAPTQDELLALVTQLNHLDLLRTDALPNSELIVHRSGRLRRISLTARILNPLAVRVPLFDPNGFLDETWPLVRPAFTWIGGLAYLILVISGIVTAARHWDALTGNLVDQLLTAESLLVLALVYPFVKALHELGHGYAVKRWGGEVREIGVMFLVFFPVPYVDASAASAFPSKGARILVGGAGILVEMGLAAAAVLLWTELEEGMVRALVFNIIIIGGISTILFNGNPLLRFDGYYVLADLLEIPNLGSRANRYIGYLVQRYLFGVPDARTTVRARGERKWLGSYAVASFIYRIIISFAIISIVITNFFFIGLILAIWAVTLMFVVPLLKHLHFLTASELLRGRRGRAFLVTGAAIAAIMLLLTAVPVPYRTIAQGVASPPEEAALFAAERGEVMEIVLPEDGTIRAGAAVARLADPLAEARLNRAEAEAERTRLRYRQAFAKSAYDTRLWRAEMARAEQEVQILRDRADNMTVRSPADGIAILPYRADLERRYLERGEVLGFVVDPEALVVQVAVPQNAADLIRRRTHAVELRPATDLTVRQSGRIVRMVPAVGGRLPGLALATVGGGPFVLDPQSPDTPRSVEPVMRVEIATDTPLAVRALGTRFYVRFDHGSEPLAFRLIRGVRQLLLSRFGV